MSKFTASVSSSVSCFFDDAANASRPSRADKRKARKILKEDRKFKRHAAPLIPKTDAQAEYLEALKENTVLITTGGAGVGKTYVAARYGIERVLDGTYDRFVMTRPMVPVSGENIGFLPGGVESKVAPWTIPVLDAIRESIPSKEDVTRMLKEEVIEFVPFAYVRGRTFKNAFILADESQNLTVEQFKVLITRVGEDSQIVIDGDLRQSDLRAANGLRFAIDMAERYNLSCEIFEFSDEDVVRSGIAAEWVRAFSDYEDYN